MRFAPTDHILVKLLGAGTYWVFAALFPKVAGVVVTGLIAAIFAIPCLLLGPAIALAAFVFLWIVFLCMFFGKTLVKMARSQD